jgi:hypothetical protein
MSDEEQKRLHQELQNYLESKTKFISYYEQMKKLSSWLEEQRS